MEIIAEIGLNHNGNFDLCYELIKQSKYAGADIVKFQLGWKSKEGELNYLNEERVNTLIKWAAYFDIEILFSIFDYESFELIKKTGINKYKVASRTVKDNIELVKDIAANNKLTYISLGMWDKNNGLPIESRENVKYLWCKSKYPSTPWDMVDLPKDFKKSPYIGYSDHTIGIDTCLLAVSRGAEVIEKHFTLDKSDSTIRDHGLSSTPDEFKTLCEIGKEISKKIKIGV